MDKIKGQLAGVAALLGVIAAIGGGFVKYGEIVTKLDALESQEWAVVDTTGIETSLAVLEEKVDALENAGGTDWSAQIAVLEEKVNSLSADHGHTKILVNEKEIQLLKVQIEELKIKSSNPLAN